MSHEACFEWREFQAQLIAEIAHAEREGESTSYYERWLHAFEQLLADKGLLDLARSWSVRATSRTAGATTCSRISPRCHPRRRACHGPRSPGQEVITSSSSRDGPPTTRCRQGRPTALPRDPAGLDSDAGGDRHGQNLAPTARAGDPAARLPAGGSAGGHPASGARLLPRRRLGDRRSRHARRSVPADHGEAASRSSPSTTAGAGAQVPGGRRRRVGATRWVVAHASELGSMAGGSPSPETAPA